MLRTFILPLFLLSPLFAFAAEGPVPPNIVIILADDLGYGDPGCYNDQSKIPTPNIDHLATEGLLLTDAHTPSSVCTPTRYGLLTGRYCWRTPLKNTVLWPWAPPLIESDRLTLPAMLRQNGYSTASFGKWHLGWDWPVGETEYFRDRHPRHNTVRIRSEKHSKLINFSRPIGGGPTHHGFDSHFGVDVPNFPPYCFIENDRTVGIPSVPKPEAMFGSDGPALPGWDLSVVMPTITQRAIQYIGDQSQDDSKPFFLYLALTAPHTPIAPTSHFIGNSQAGWYGDFVNQVDWTVGQVVSALERAGIEENTLLIFTSDNGSPQRSGRRMHGKNGSVKKEYGHDPSRPWRGMKADVWEAGHRVPFIARWPGKVPAAQTSDEPIVLTDMMRTISKIVGHQLPDDAAEDSFDVSSVLFGQEISEPIHDYLIHHSFYGKFGIRQGHWKLIECRDSGGFTKYEPPEDAPAGQLYNLAKDPSESNNLYNEHPEIVAKLGEILKQAREEGRTYVD